jgi:hypothetical protein
MQTFKKALNQLPDGTGFDSFVHKTVEDLCWICLHELDLHAEEEYFVPLALRRQYLSFIRKNKFYVKEAEAMFIAGRQVQESDCYI